MQRKGKEDHKAWLVKAIESEVIPRLMLAHKAGNVKKTSISAEDKKKHIFSKDSIEAFTRILLKNDIEIVRSYVEALLDEGVMLEDVYLELFQPSARLLGESWEEDTEDFSSITLALWKIQHTMYFFSESFLNDSIPTQRKGSVFLCPYPESQHTVGLFMVSEFFRKDNWLVTAEPSITPIELEKRISSNFFDLLGISIGSLAHVEKLPELINIIRKVSKNPNIFLMIGGPMTSISQNLYQEVGADAQASNAKEALLKASDLLQKKIKS